MNHAPNDFGVYEVGLVVRISPMQRAITSRSQTVAKLEITGSMTETLKLCCNAEPRLLSLNPSASTATVDASTTSHPTAQPQYNEAT